VERQLEHYQKNNQRFASTFPIVLRYMIQLRMYHEKAFVKFIKKMQAKPYRSKLEFCERQADYVKYLYQELTPHYPENEAKRIWKQTYDMLEKEVKMFDDAEKKVKEKLEKNNITNENEKRNELKNILDKL
jgi:bacterioferritin (cytochrome b1)